MLCANFSQLWGCGEQLFISGKQTRPITSSGGWCGQGGQRTGGDQQVFFLLLLFQRQSHPKHLCAHTCTHPHRHAHISAHTQENSYLFFSLQNCDYLGCLHWVTYLPNCFGVVMLVVCLYFPCSLPFLGNNCNMRSCWPVWDICRRKLSKSVCFHSCSGIHLPKIATPSPKIIDMYLCSGWLQFAPGQALFVLFYQARWSCSASTSYQHAGQR